MRLKSMSAADTLRARLTELAAAVTLLTWLPVHRLPLGSAPNSASAVWAYPLVGALVGGIGGGAYWLAAAFACPSALAAPWTLAVLILMTGALHEDGLADFADGLGGNTKEQSLAIMRDHRIGSYGVIALILSLAIRITAIAVIAETSAVAAALIAAAATSRLAAVLVMAALPAARADGISASVGRPRGARAAAALGVTFVISWLLLPFGMALIAIIAAATAALAIGAIASARLGGQTGDVLGAAVVLAECLVLTALASALA
jgi:adenosylcobinamide-GDP ribazoletransferase